MTKTIKSLILSLRTTQEFNGLDLEAYQVAAVVQATRQTWTVGTDLETLVAGFLRMYL